MLHARNEDGDRLDRDDVQFLLDACISAYAAITGEVWKPEQDQTPADARWMLGLGTRAEVENYLGFGSVLCSPVIRSRSGREVWIIRADSLHNALWQGARLQSGMRGGVVLLHSFDDAVAEAERLAVVL
jgi:hypothetical protein